MPVLVSAGQWDLQSPGPTLGQMSKNVANQSVGVLQALEAFLYIAGICFFMEAIRRTIKHAKHNNSGGRGELERGWVATIAMCYVAAVFCFAAPTLLESGAASLFDKGPVKTVGAPGPSFSPN